jgi:hypothetical protein
LPSAGGFIESQPGIAADIAALPGIATDDCIGHSPIVPLAASPLMGSITHSMSSSKVRKNFMLMAVGGTF